MPMAPLFTRGVRRSHIGTRSKALDSVALATTVAERTVAVLTIKFHGIMFVSLDALSSYICRMWGDWSNALSRLEGADLAICKSLSNVNPKHLEWASDGGVVFETGK